MPDMFFLSASGPEPVRSLQESLGTERILWTGRCAVAEYAFDEPASLPRWTLPEETGVVVTETRVVFVDPAAQAGGELHWLWPQHLRVQPGNRDTGRSATVTQIQLVCNGATGAFPALVFAGGDLSTVGDADRLANVLRQAIARFRVEHSGELGLAAPQARMLSRSVIGPEFNNYQGGEGQTVTLLGSMPVEGPVHTTTGPAHEAESITSVPAGRPDWEQAPDSPGWAQPADAAAWTQSADAAAGTQPADAAAWTQSAGPAAWTQPGDAAAWAQQAGPGAWTQPGDAAGWEELAQGADWEELAQGADWEQPAADAGTQPGGAAAWGQPAAGAAWGQPGDAATRRPQRADTAWAPSGDAAGWEQPIGHSAWEQPAGPAAREQSGGAAGWEQESFLGEHLPQEGYADGLRYAEQEPHPYADYHAGPESMPGAQGYSEPQPMPGAQGHSEPQPMPAHPVPVPQPLPSLQPAPHPLPVPQPLPSLQPAPHPLPVPQPLPSLQPAPHPLPVPQPLPSMQAPQQPQPLPAGRAVRAPEAEYTDLASRAADLAARVASLVSANAGAEQSLERYETQTTNLSAFLADGEGGQGYPGDDGGFPGHGDEGRAEAARRTAARFAGNSARGRATGQRPAGDDHSTRPRNA